MKNFFRYTAKAQDLFDISKVQSGNDDVVLEKLDVSLLINQALGEHDNEIQGSGLPFCGNVCEAVTLSAYACVERHNAANSNEKNFFIGKTFMVNNKKSQ